MAQSFFRYPGGKSKFSKQIVQCIMSCNFQEYREPFIGGGSIAIEIMDNGGHFNPWINDKDIGIYCLWRAIAEQPDELTTLVRNFVPAISEFDRLKQFFLTLDAVPDDFVTAGFNKLAIHQISFSGLGVMSGGPLGGKDQTSQYHIDCRWSVPHLVKKIERLHRCFSQVQITNCDFGDLFEPSSNSVMLYLDPPYYVKGAELYQHAFTEHDHRRLSELLRNTEHHWVLSYDDCEEIRTLYDWADIVELDATYSINTARQKRELLITKST